MRSIQTVCSLPSDTTVLWGTASPVCEASRQNIKAKCYWPARIKFSNQRFICETNAASKPYKQCRLLRAALLIDHHLVHSCKAASKDFPQYIKHPFPHAEHRYREDERADVLHEPCPFREIMLFGNFDAPKEHQDKPKKRGYADEKTKRNESRVSRRAVE